MYERINLGNKKPEATNRNPASQIRRRIEHSRSINSPVDRILFLQRTIGNQAVQKLVRSGTLQAKLKIGQPGDVYEQEADRVSEHVMRMPDVSEAKDTRIQRKCPKCLKGLTGLIGKDKKEEKLQAKEISRKTPEITSQTEENINALKGGGQPLPESTRAFFEPRFGRDFSNVQLHTDAKAAESARTVNARAYTIGEDVVFAAGQYSNGTHEGQKLLAHELTHVVQQKGIRNVNYMQEKSGFSLQDSGLPKENKADLSPNHELIIEGRIEEDFTPNQLSIQRACGRKEIGSPKCASMGGNVSCNRPYENCSRPFLFEKNCDTFKTGEDNALKEFVLNNGSTDAFIEIHGFASMVGPFDFNLNLSCARAHRAISALTDAGISTIQIRPPIKHGPTEGDEIQRQSVVILIEEKPKAPPPCTFNHSAAAAYARTWASSFNPAFVRFNNDCTNFVSQAMLAGGWCMIFGRDMCAERKNNNVWWYQQNACQRWLRSDIHASHTWGGAQNFADFVSSSGRGTLAKSEMDLVEGDILQMRFNGSAEIGHSMIVTNKTSTELFLSYHTANRLNEPFSAIKSRNPGAVFVPWKIS